MKDLDGYRHCDRCGAILTRKNNKCGYEICDKCNEYLDDLVKNKPQESEDCISRQAVCKIIDDIRDCVSVNGYWAFLERLNKLPSAKPQETILEKIRATIENHCGLAKENHCKYCSYCNCVMGVREILEIIYKYIEESEEI